MPLEEWCSNSRRWVIWMTALSRIPSTCPYNFHGKGCVGKECGYYQMREPTTDFKRTERRIRAAFSEDSAR